MKNLLIALLISTSATAALASDTQRCFERTYSAAHLKKNPKQLAKSIRVTLTQEDHIYNTVEVKTAKFVKGGISFSSGGACQISSGTLACGFDGDGGNYIFEDLGSTAVLRVKSALFLYNVENHSEDEISDRDLVLEAGKDNGIYYLKNVKCK